MYSNWKNEKKRAPPYKTRQIKFLLHKDLNIIQ